MDFGEGERESMAESTKDLKSFMLEGSSLTPATRIQQDEDVDEDDVEEDDVEVDDVEEDSEWKLLGPLVRNRPK